MIRDAAERCRAAALRLQLRLDAMIERDGSEEAAIAGPGVSIGYLLARKIKEALTGLTDEHDRRVDELLAATAALTERARAAEHDAAIWRNAALVLAEAGFVAVAAQQALAAELHRVRAGDPNGHIPIRGPRPPAQIEPAD